MKTVEFTVIGRTLHLCLNGAALFDIYDNFGDKDSVVDHIAGNTRASFRATCWILAKLAEQGELVRRAQGYDRCDIPTAQLFQLNLKPKDVAAAKHAIREAVALGFAREEKDDADQPIDLGLQELQKKTGPG